MGHITAPTAGTASSLPSHLSSDPASKTQTSSSRLSANPLKIMSGEAVVSEYKPWLRRRGRYVKPLRSSLLCLTNN